MTTPTTRALLEQVLARLDALEARGPVVASKPRARSRKAKVNTFHRDVIVGKAAARRARKALAATLRAQGVEPRGDAWEAAKAEAGLD